MTHDDLQIVLDVLRESWRLSDDDAQALTTEIARRVLAPRPTPTCDCWETPEVYWDFEEVMVGHLCTCKQYMKAKAAI